jgi:5-methylcytosine-specific restriction endonuclease McrA
LEQKYLAEGLGTARIARLVGRDPKRVYEWLVGYGIPLREKWKGNVPKPGPYHDSAWLRAEYERGQTLADIAAGCGVAPGTVFRYVRRFGLVTRTAGESARLTGRTHRMPGERNPMHGRRPKSWKGGCTPERQAFYSSSEWLAAAKEVWKRDRATCQRCGAKKRRKDEKFCIHHLVSFAVKQFRARLSNLALLCEACHLWVHSRENVGGEFIKEWDGGFQATSG